jgi:hypothetical protein
LGKSALRQRPVITGILVAGVALQAFFIVAHGVNKELLGDGTFLALDHDASLPSWATVVLFALAGICCALLAWLNPESRMPLAVLAGFSLALSLESTVQLHGQVERDSDNPFRSLVQLLGGAGFVAALLLVARALSRPFRWFLLLAVATIVAAAGASEMNDKFDLPYVGVIFFQTVEEVCEMMTAILVLAAVAEPLIAAIERRLVTSESDSFSEPRPKRERADATPRQAR